MNRLLTRLLPGCGSCPRLHELARLLNVPYEELQSVTTDPRLSYRPFSIRKRGGGRRKIVAPSGRLKLLQRRLLENYLSHQPVHEAATAFRRGGSIVNHAHRHLGQAIVLTADLADFFPATSARRVRAWFQDQGWQGLALDVLMRLCVFSGGLPQGAPTSPALSNLVNLPLDQKLSELASLHRARYSRYCDDLAFSWGGELEPPAFRLQVADVLHAYRYQLQVQKGWRLQRAQEQPELNGLILDGHRLRLTKAILVRLKQAQARWRGGEPGAAAQLEGYRGLRAMLRRKALRFHP